MKSIILILSITKFHGCWCPTTSLQNIHGLICYYLIYFRSQIFSIYSLNIICFESSWGGVTKVSFDVFLAYLYLLGLLLQHNETASSGVISSSVPKVIFATLVTSIMLHPKPFYKKLLLCLSKRLYNRWLLWPLVGRQPNTNHFLLSIYH